MTTPDARLREMNTSGRLRGITLYLPEDSPAYEVVREAADLIDSLTSQLATIREERDALAKAAVVNAHIIEHDERNEKKLLAQLATLRLREESTARQVRGETIEECAKVAKAHDADQGIKKLGKANFRGASEEARMAMRDEARGERIASEMIAQAIRALLHKEADDGA